MGTWADITEADEELEMHMGSASSLGRLKNFHTKFWRFEQ